MSKRVPVELTKKELEDLIDWASIADGEGMMLNPSLLERLEQELERFE